MNTLRRFWGDESGLELSEYAVMLALIVVVLFIVISKLATAIEGKFSETAEKITSGS